MIAWQSKGVPIARDTRGRMSAGRLRDVPQNGSDRRIAVIRSAAGQPTNVGRHRLLFDLA
jgi:hypothetical protein